MTTTPDPTDDLAYIKGAEAIAKMLRISTSQFYQARHRGGCAFVWHEPGVGLVTTRAAIRRYQEARAAGQEPPKVGPRANPLAPAA